MNFFEFLLNCSSASFHSNSSCNSRSCFWHQFKFKNLNWIFRSHSQFNSELHKPALSMDDSFCCYWMNLRFYSQFHPHFHQNPDRGSARRRQQTSSAFQTGSWKVSVPESWRLHLLWQRNLAHSEWPTDSPDPDTYNLKEQKHRSFKEYSKFIYRHTQIYTYSPKGLLGTPY